jgi:hypothetical protein
MRRQGCQTFPINTNTTHTMKDTYSITPHTVRHDEDGDSGTRFWIITGSLATVENLLAKDGRFDSARCGHDYDCCGCGFRSSAYIRRSSRKNTRHLVTQSFGRNV